VDALTVQGLLLGGKEDGVLTRVGVPESFMEYLSRQEMDIPRICRYPDVDRGMHFSPFGWNREAMMLSSRQQHPVPHPEFEVVRQVNGRVFSATLERDLLSERDAGRVFSSFEELRLWIGKESPGADGWVVKADHSNAGLGNRRLVRAEPDRAEERFVTRLFAEDDQVLVEPWRRRLLDLCAVFTLCEDGGMEGFRIHETINTSDGALIGVVFDGAETRWRDSIEKAAEAVAGELSRNRYFGPVCFDAFVYLLDGAERLRALADLNCRRPMSDAVFRLWREEMADRVFLWRFFNTGRIDLEAVASMAESEAGFCRRERRGVLFTSPWTIEHDGRTLPAPKVAIAFVGESRGQVQEMEASFRRRFEK
jgi:hypothetical protein